jgi:type II secretory pathway pseudopilin PulG
MRHHSIHRRRSGFTLLELLVVIGIIMVLMAMAVIGYNVVERSAAGRETKTTLADLHGMLAELDAAVGSTALPTSTYKNAAGATVTALFGAITASGDPDAPSADTTPLPVNQAWNIDDVTTNAPARNYNSANSPHFSNNVMQQTQNAMGALMAVPANQAAVSQLPSKLIMKVMDSNPSVNTMVPTSPPILLDGWGNPIIYVPSSGIVVYVNNPSSPSSPLMTITIKSHDGRPFFASAGPDGNFGATSGNTTAYGDDNVYSFEK